MSEIKKDEQSFAEVLLQINSSKQNVFSQINTALLELYWNVGSYISKRVKNKQWGKSTVVELADYIKLNSTELKGFGEKNLWRMKQYFETYNENAKLASLGRELSWTHNRRIMKLN